MKRGFIDRRREGGTSFPAPAYQLSGYVGSLMFDADLLGVASAV